MILQYFNLAGKVAVISGCNTGLGQAMALALAEAGDDRDAVDMFFRAAHSMKSGARYMGIEEMEETASRIESLLARGPKQTASSARGSKVARSAAKVLAISIGPGFR